jgi:Fe-S oxidoreductase
MEVLLGVHRNKLMPSFARTAFMRWFRKYRRTNPAHSSQDKVVLFRTCFVNYNNPDVGRAAVQVLEKSRVQVECPEEHCCGMPGINSGDLKFALKKMMKNVKLLLPYVERGYLILAINPTCSLTLKKEYINFLPPGQWREDARKVSAAVRDLNEYLFELKKDERFNRDFKSSPGPVSYHAPCHLRAQNIGFRSRDLMKLIPGAELSFTAECCGHNGTWAMKKENFEASLKTGQKAFDSLSGSRGAETRVATDCPLAAIQIEQGAGLSERPVHPVQVLARAYLAPGEGGYAQPADRHEN